MGLAFVHDDTCLLCSGVPCCSVYVCLWLCSLSRYLLPRTGHHQHSYHEASLLCHVSVRGGALQHPAESFHSGRCHSIPSVGRDSGQLLRKPIDHGPDQLPGGKWQTFFSFLRWLSSSWAVGGGGGGGCMCSNQAFLQVASSASTATVEATFSLTGISWSANRWTVCVLSGVSSPVSQALTASNLTFSFVIFVGCTLHFIGLWLLWTHKPFSNCGKRIPEDRGERTVIGFVFPQQPKPNYCSFTMILGNLSPINLKKVSSVKERSIIRLFCVRELATATRLWNETVTALLYFSCG